VKQLTHNDRFIYEASYEACGPCSVLEEPDVPYSQLMRITLRCRARAGQRAARLFSALVVAVRPAPQVAVSPALRMGGGAEYRLSSFNTVIHVAM
jgi:hypothetical protein